MNRRRGLTALLLASLVLLAAACGRKTLPVPPETVRPAPIADLRSQLDEKGVTLLWTAPARTAGGRKLPAIEGFEIFRAVVPEEEYCPGCPLPFGPPIKYEDDPPQPGETVRYREPVLRPDHRYVYKVRTRYSWFLTSPDSNLVSFSWAVLPAAPQELAIASGDRELALSWQRPRELVDGTSFTGPLQYQVERSQDGEEFAPLGRPLTEELVDRAVRNGVTYHYRVRALRQVQETHVAGLASETATATPRDLTPPAPPRELTAIKTPQGVRLLWPAGAEPDLAGYRIYRRSGTEAASAIGEVTVPDTTFLDREPPARGRVFYMVVAFDTARPANESAPSREAEVQF
jgi:uncharacterized protein